MTHPDRETLVRALGRERLLEAIPGDWPEGPPWAPLLEREWLVTNGLGGYASGTVSGATTRRYHALLVSAEPPPLGRVVTLVDLVETVRREDGTEFRLGGEERPEALELHGARHLRAFRLEWGLPVWTYELGDLVLDKRLVLEREANTVVVSYHLLRGGRARLELQPVVRLRQHDTAVDRPLEPGYHLERDAEGLRVTGVEGFPDLRLRAGRPGAFREEPCVMAGFLYRVEASRGYAAVGDNWCPGRWSLELEEGEPITLAASTAPWERVPTEEEAAGLWEREILRRRGLVRAAHPALRQGAGAELVLAADQFLIRSMHPRGGEREDERSVIAGYHWFTDWGRDTMISLEGLTLLTGREAEARAILLTFGRYIRDGLVPNMFPEGRSDGLYHTADASLWYFHAIDRYLRHTGDRATLERLLPGLREIVDAHMQGTRFGIGVDPEDGLLAQGADSYQLTWMDAKVDDWVVTPRRGKAVEINALWYNALRLTARWERQAGEASRADAAERSAARARDSFNRRFWMEDEGYLLDVVDGQGGDDPAFRPNQIFAVSLPHPVLASERWAAVVEAVGERLLTPVGLRSLAPGHPDYRSTYFGDLRTRDAAYHQGTVWAWLIGPYVDAWLRVHPTRAAAAGKLVSGLLTHLDEFCIGTIAEVFDAETPHRPRGCVAQAWSASEVLRCLVRADTDGDGAREPPE